MNSFVKSINGFVEDRSNIFSLFLAFFLLFAIEHSTLMIQSRMLIALASLLGLIISSLRKNSLVWGVIALTIAYNLLGASRFVAANHTYLALYTSLLLFFTTLKDEKEFVTENHLRYLFIVFMGLATFHKIWSEEFLSGDFMSLVLGTNPHFQNFLAWAVDFDFRTIAANNSSLQIDGVYPPAISKSFELPKEIQFWGSVLTWGTILGEGFLVILAILGRRARELLSSCLFLFVLGTSVIRMEYIFLSFVSLYAYSFTSRFWKQVALLLVFLYFSLMSVLDGTLIFYR